MTHENVSGSQGGSALTPTPTPTPPTLPPTSTPTTIAVDATPSEDPSPQEVGTKRKPPCRPPSSAWKHFKKDDVKQRAICVHCGKDYKAYTTNHGTSNLLKHIDKYPENPNNKFDKKQKTIALGAKSEGDNIVSIKLVDFKQEECRRELAKMIIRDELSFKFVDNPGFRAFMSKAQPRFKVPSRVTIAKDCMLLYAEEKAKLKSILELNKQMVSFTTDAWTSIQNLNYMCVTAHFIDEGWMLNKKILSFKLISDHKGETIGRALETTIKEWGINKIYVVTVDNATSNSTALSYLNRSIDNWNGTTILKGEYMHMRCNAHILNLIIGDGLKELDSSIVRIRAACKYVKTHPSRALNFRCVTEARLVTTKAILLDVPTRWNSTYLMLVAAEKYESAFTLLEYDDLSFGSTISNDGGPPTSDYWSRTHIFIKFLKIFYDATLTFSSSLHVTANTFFDNYMISKPRWEIGYKVMILCKRGWQQI